MVLAREIGMHTADHFQHIAARATSGCVLDIRYDPVTNALVFLENDWRADVRGAALPRATFREQLETATIRRLPQRRAA